MTTDDVKWQNFVLLRNSPAVVADLERRAAAIATAAAEQVGDDGEEHFKVMPTEFDLSIRGRARVAVVTSSFKAMYHEATERTLTKAVDAGRS